MRLAVVADIHGNYPAFEAVLSDIDRQGVDETIVAGDFLNAAPFPCEVLDAMRGRGLRAVMGNHEEYLLRFQTDPAAFPEAQWGSVHWTAAQLSPSDFDDMQALPTRLVVDGVAVMHGSPQSTTQGVLPSTPATDLATYYGDVSQQVIVSAHTHVPGVYHWQDKLIVNPGAVGIPLDRIPLPSYAILTRHNGRWLVQHRRVTYDHERVKRAFRTRGLLDVGGTISALYLEEILTGHILLSPFLWRLLPRMKATGIQDFAEGVRRFGADCQGTDPAYGLPGD